MPRIRLGDHGLAVAEIRNILLSEGLLAGGPVNPALITNGWAPPEAVFDSDVDHAIRAFQQKRGLLVDGIVGPATHRALQEAQFRLGTRTLTYNATTPLYGDDVAMLQSKLQNLGFYNGLVDGYFGASTHDGLAMYQREFGLVDDGVCGPATLRSLDFLGSRVSGGSPHALREMEQVRDRGPKLTGKRIVIDPGLGGRDSGKILHGFDGPTTEADVLWDIASRLCERMRAAGIECYFSRTESENPSDPERAYAANRFDADVMISLRCASYRNDKANGAACFHFGNTHGSYSTIGLTLASYIQREIVARSPLSDCRFHGRTWDLLRLTRMPTVQVDVGYVTNNCDVDVITNPRFRDHIAEAIVVGVKRLYLLGNDDQPTGTYTFAELLALEELADKELAAGS